MIDLVNPNTVFVSELVEGASAWNVERLDLACTIVDSNCALLRDEFMRAEIGGDLSQLLHRDLEMKKLCEPSYDVSFSLHSCKSRRDRVQVVGVT